MKEKVEQKRWSVFIGVRDSEGKGVSQVMLVDAYSPEQALWVVRNGHKVAGESSVNVTKLRIK